MLSRLLAGAPRFGFAGIGIVGIGIAGSAIAGSGAARLRGLLGRCGGAKHLGDAKRPLVDAGEVRRGRSLDGRG